METHEIEAQRQFACRARDARRLRMSGSSQQQWDTRSSTDHSPLQINLIF